MTLTVRDIARLLSVSEKTVYRWISRGELPAYQVHEQYRFNRAEILEWATSRKIPVSPEIFAEPETKGVAMPSLFDALQSGGINYRVVGADKWTVLKNMVQLLQLPEEVDREFLLRVLVAREELSSTGIGDGIAIPHVRNPVVLHISKPMVTLFFLEHPVDFGAIDGQPVFALFMLISPTVRAHLHLLSRLAYTLGDQNFRAAILRQGLRDEILEAAQRVEEALVSGANASKHLQILRGAHLVEARKDGLHVYYRLADEGVCEFFRGLRKLAESRLAEIDRIIAAYFGQRDTLQPVDRRNLLRRAKKGEIVVLDVRPRDEYLSGHLPHAQSIPLSELKKHLDRFSPDVEIVAYCRGPYCVLAQEAVSFLRQRGFDAVRMEDGVNEWKEAGLPVIVGE